MATLVDGYGLGLFDIVDPGPTSYGHAGGDIGFSAWAGCIPESGSVIVALINGFVDDLGGLPSPLVAAAMEVAAGRAP